MNIGKLRVLFGLSALVWLTSTCRMDFPSGMQFEELWYSPITEHAMVTDIALADDQHFYLGESALTFSVDPPFYGARLYKVDHQGKLIWEVNIPSLITGKYEDLDSAETIEAFSIQGDQLLVGTTVGNPFKMTNDKAELFSISKHSGQLNWHYRMEDYSGDPELHPFVYAGYVVAVSDGFAADEDPTRSSIHVLDDTGNLIVRRQLPFRTYARGLNYVWDNRLYTRGREYDIASVDLDKAIDSQYENKDCVVLAVPHSDETSSGDLTDFVCFDDKVAYGNNVGVVCRNIDTGAVEWLWKYPTGNGSRAFLEGTISYDDDFLFVPINFGMVACLKKSTGEQVWLNNGSLDRFWNMEKEGDRTVRWAQRGIIIEDRWFIHGFQQMGAIIVYDYQTGRKLLGIPNDNMQGSPIQHLFYIEDILYVVENYGIRAYRIIE